VTPRAFRFRSTTTNRTPDARLRFDARGRWRNRFLEPRSAFAQAVSASLPLQFGLHLRDALVPRHRVALGIAQPGTSCPIKFRLTHLRRDFERHPQGRPGRSLLERLAHFDEGVFPHGSWRTIMRD
jgi:hypothetical protein